MKDADHVKVAKYAIRKGHTLGYRVDPDNDEKFEEYPLNKLKRELTQAKQNFRKVFRKNLHYVLFPWGVNKVRKHVQLTKKLGLVPVEANLLVDEFRAEDPKAITKYFGGKIDEVRGNFFTYQDSSLTEQDVVVSHIKDAAKKYKLSLLTLDECLSGKIGGDSSKGKKGSLQKYIKGRQIAKNKKKKSHGHKKGDKKSDTLSHLIGDSKVEGGKSKKRHQKNRKDDSDEIDHKKGKHKKKASKNDSIDDDYTHDVDILVDGKSKNDKPNQDDLQKTAKTEDPKEKAEQEKAKLNTADPKDKTEVKDNFAVLGSSSSPALAAILSVVVMIASNTLF